MAPNDHINIDDTVNVLNKMGLLKVIVFNVVYIWTLFLLCAISVLVITVVYPLSATPGYSAIVIAVVFGIIATIDFGRVYQNKISPTIIMMVLLFAAPYVLYRLFYGFELINLDKNVISKVVRQNIFPNLKNTI